eukprot:363469-Pyramimonas_sp.AAC.1
MAAHASRPRAREIVEGRQPLSEDRLYTPIPPNSADPLAIVVQRHLQENGSALCLKKTWNAPEKGLIK